MKRSLLAVLAVALCSTVPASAQTSLGLGVQLLDLGGSDFDGISAGIGVEGRVMFPVGASALLGAGAQYSSHGIDGIDPNFNVLGLIAEGRYLFKRAGGKVTPYVGGRGGYVHGSASQGGNSVTASGYAIGATGGVQIQTSPTMSFDLGLAFHSVKLGDAKANGTTQPGTKSSGTGLQIRAGVSFKLGGK